MLFSIVVSLIVCLSIVVTSVVKPNIHIKNIKLNLYWIIALVGGILILATSKLSFSEWWNALTRKDSINPIQILILFLSMSLISIFLDEVGFFSHLANWTLKKVKSSQFTLFIVLYAFVSILTMFTSNDIIILTLTPFILFFCKNAKISPIPYIVSEFIAANTWSMIFIIGNPTNIYLASSFNITFIDYFKVMAIPTLLTGITEFIILLLVFKKRLSKKLEPTPINLPKQNMVLTTIGITILVICTVLLVISGYVDIPMYLISAISFGCLFITSMMYYLISRTKPNEIVSSLKRGPYEIVPFIIGMFTLVLALEKFEVTNKIASFFGNSYPTLVYGYSSALSSNLVNNIPMSVLYSSICAFADPSIRLSAIYASIVGSNIGAFISPLGALAGIMWLNILKKNEVKFTYIDFVKYGLIVGIPSITVTLFSLILFL